MTRTLAAALAAVLALSAPLFAEDPPIEITDAYLRVLPGAASGAAFLVIHNTGAEDDRLIAAASDAAQRVELHTHSEDAQGVMRMREVVEGFAVPAGGTHALERGADHVMFMGMTRTLAEGDVVAVTLTFEKAGAIAVDLPVDNSRMPGAMQGQGHGQTHGMKHGG